MTKEIINQHYDAHLYNVMLEEYFEGSDYANFGYWTEGERSAKQACNNLMEKLLAFIPDKNGSILDVACGKGATTRYLSKYFAKTRITAINISEKQLKTAKQNAAGVDFLIMDAADLAFEDNSFDHIICVEAVFHFYTRERFFQEALRVLKPGGHIVLSDVLFKDGAEKKMRSFHEENYLMDQCSYESLWKKVGFRRGEIINATNECWQGHFWNVVKFIHSKYLRHEINLETAKKALDVTYRITPDLESYLLVCLQK